MRTWLVTVAVLWVGCASETLEGNWVLAEGVQLFEPENLCGPARELEPGTVALDVQLTDGGVGTATLVGCTWSVEQSADSLDAPVPQECNGEDAVFTLNLLSLELVDTELRMLKNHNITLESGISCDVQSNFAFVRP